MPGLTRHTLINRSIGLVAMHRVATSGTKSTDAEAKAYNRIEGIFAKYEIKT